MSPDVVLAWALVVFGIIGIVVCAWMAHTDY